MKKCPDCNLVKSPLEFTHDSSSSDGLSRLCRVCRGIARRDYKIRNTKEYRAEVQQQAELKRRLLAQNQKKCSMCHQVKFLSEFHRKSDATSTTQSFCKLCGRQSHTRNRKLNPGKEFQQHRRRVYGIAPEDFEQVVLNQNKKCAICKVPFTKTPHLDHDHSTGKIRGVLCGKCNVGLGLFKESPQILVDALLYLNRA